MIFKSNFFFSDQFFFQINFFFKAVAFCFQGTRPAKKRKKFFGFARILRHLFPTIFSRSDLRFVAHRSQNSAHHLRPNPGSTTNGARNSTHSCQKFVLLAIDGSNPFATAASDLKHQSDHLSRHSKKIYERFYSLNNICFKYRI